MIQSALKSFMRVFPGTRLHLFLLVLVLATFSTAQASPVTGVNTIDGQDLILGTDGNQYVYMKSTSSYPTCPGCVGVGIALPHAALDIAGDIRAVESSNSCTASNIGAMRYFSSNDAIQYCAANNGSPQWETASGGANEQCDAYTNQSWWYVCANVSTGKTCSYNSGGGTWSCTSDAKFNLNAATTQCVAFPYNGGNELYCVDKSNGHLCSVAAATGNDWNCSSPNGWSQ